RMRMPDTALLESLELPDDANLGKLPSAVGTDSLNGSQHFRIFGSASNAGTEKRLNSAAAYAAVMYRFSGYDFHKDPASLRITTSEHDFGGDTPGFVVAVADYEAGRWSYFGS